MRRTAFISIAVIVLFLIAYGDKVKDRNKIIEARRFSAARAAGGRVKVSVRGHVYSIDLYEYPNVPGGLPEGGMTFEAARRACRRAGKRLCTNEEWTEACMGMQLDRYAYGGVFHKDACNNLHGDRRVAPSGAFKRCRTETGIYDMAGNLWEWVAPSATGAWLAKGGSYRDGEISERCEFTFKLFAVQEKHLAFDNFGTRCCGDAAKTPSQD
ncbi:MAG: SUMF1/EgtB/PvdO family nonheme iron enzyme [bacterium]